MRKLLSYWQALAAASFAALAMAALIVQVSTSLHHIQASLPQYGFFALRDLHIMLRDVTHWKDMLELARLIPEREEARERVAEANDLIHIRFVGIDAIRRVDDLPNYARMVAAVRATLAQVDGLLAAAPPLDAKQLQEAIDKVAALEDRIADIYYAYSETSNIAIEKAQGDLRSLNLLIALALALLAVLAIGTSLLWIGRRNTLRRLEYLVWRDTLTGLRNRAWLLRGIETYMVAARSGNPGFALCLIDLDRFKAINDTHGHHVGDLLLQWIAGQLRQTEKQCRGAAAVRLGGDEFALVVPDASGADTAIREFIERTNGVTSLGGHQLAAGTSIGIARYPEHGEDIDTLLRHADYALYAAKTEGRSRAVTFTQDLHETAAQRLQIEAALRRAIVQDEFFLLWQPQFDLATGSLSGAEALLRWRDAATGEVVPPSAFIPIAEASNLIADIDRLVLRKACEEAARWHRHLASPPTCSVNISSQQLQNCGFPAELADLLERTGLPPSGLELEITEGSVIENRTAATLVLRDIQRLGVCIALDDFGTGYSSLSYLAELPINRLKIDKSFVAGLEDTPRKKNVVSSIMALSRSLNMAVVAEGIESAAQLDALAREQCGFGQGFFLARPVEGNVLLLRLGGPCRHYSDWQRQAAQLSSAA